MEAVEELDYDIVVYGTGLVNCLVTSILLKKLNNSGEPRDSEDEKEKAKGVKILTVDKHGEYGNNYRTLSMKQFLSLKNSKSLKDDFSGNEKEEGNKDSQSLWNGESNTIYYEINPFGDQENESEFKNLIKNKNNEFNVDLWPKLILNNSHFVEYLVSTNLYKQIQFTTNFDSNIYYFNFNSNSKDGNAKRDDNSAENSNDGKEAENVNSEDNCGKDDSEEDLSELVYDKGSIFRSSYLTMREKRILTKFLFSTFCDRNNTSDNNKDSQSKTDNNKDGKGEDWVDYLRRNDLNEKLVNLVNYGMCFNQRRLPRAELNKIKLNNYLTSFDPNKGNRNCFIYSLYGLNNIVQYICRLCSLYDCHFMLNNRITALSVNSSKHTNSGDFNDDNKEDDVQKSENGSLDNKLKNKSGMRKFLVELDGFKIRTDYVISEYELPLSDALNSSSLQDSLENSNLKDDLEDDGAENSEDSSGEAKTLVTCFITNKRLFEGFNSCVAFSSFNNNNNYDNNNNNYDNDLNDNNNLDNNNLDNNKKDNDNLDNDNLDNLTSNNKKDDDNLDKKDNNDKKGDESVIYVVQTCKDNLTSPEGVFLVYFVTKTKESYSERVDLKELVAGRVKRRELWRVFKLFEKLSGSLSNVLFVSYASFSSTDKVTFFLPDAFSDSFQVHETLFSLDSLCLFDELYISQHLADSFIQLYNSTVNNHYGKDVNKHYDKDVNKEDKDNKDGKDNPNKDYSNDNLSKEDGKYDVKEEDNLDKDSKDNLDKDYNDNKDGNDNPNKDYSKDKDGKDEEDKEDLGDLGDLDEKEGFRGVKVTRTKKRVEVDERMVRSLDLEGHIRYRQEEESEWEVNCDFLTELINKFF